MSLDTDAQPRVRSAQAAKAQPGAPAASILLVDDDPDCRMLISDAIEEACPGTIIYHAANAEQGLCYLRNEAPFPIERPSLIYLDVEMPGMNGVELAAVIKLNPALCDIPVIMMTGVSDEQRIAAAATCGANSYIIKPCDAAKFHETVAETTRYWLTLHQYPDRHMPAELARR